MANMTLNPEMTLTEKLSILDKISNAINTKAGKKLIGRVGADPEIAEKLKIKYIPTPCTDLNEAIGGGFPKGRLTVVSGAPDSGKTGLVLESIGKNMKADPNFVAGWLESEKSLSEDHLRIFNIDPERFFYMETDRKEGAEGVLDRVEAFLGTRSINLFCINSLKCLVPANEINKSMKEVSVAEQARMNSKMIKKFTPLISENEVSFVVVQHLTTMIGSMSRDPLELAGGRAIRHAASIILDLRKQAIIDIDPIEKTEGMKVNVTVKKNHCVCDRFPYVKLQYFAIYNEGIEQILSTLDKAINQNVLAKKGAWIYWMNEDGTQRYGWQGKAQFRSFMKEHPEILEELSTKVHGQYKKLSGLELAEVLSEEKETEICSKELLDTIDNIELKEEPTKHKTKTSKK